MSLSWFWVSLWFAALVAGCLSFFLLLPLAQAFVERMRAKRDGNTERFWHLACYIVGHKWDSPEWTLYPSQKEGRPAWGRQDQRCMRPGCKSFRTRVKEEGKKARVTLVF